MRLTTLLSVRHAERLSPFPVNPLPTQHCIKLEMEKALEDANQMMQQLMPASLLGDGVGHMGSGAWRVGTEGRVVAVAVDNECPPRCWGTRWVGSVRVRMGARAIWCGCGRGELGADVGAGSWVRMGARGVGCGWGRGELGADGGAGSWVRMGARGVGCGCGRGELGADVGAGSWVRMGARGVGCGWASGTWGKGIAAGGRGGSRRANQRGSMGDGIGRGETRMAWAACAVPWACCVGPVVERSCPPRCWGTP